MDDLSPDWYLEQEYEDRHSYDSSDDADALASAGYGTDEDYRGYDDWDDAEFCDPDAEF